jgi:hypothetical protein
MAQPSPSTIHNTAPTPTSDLKPAAPAPAQDPPAAAATTAAINPTVDKPTTAVPPPPVAKRAKIGRSLLQEVHAQNELSLQNKKEIAELTPALASQLIQDYAADLKNNESMAMAAQLMQMHVTVIPPDEIRLMCVSTINYHFGHNLRDKILEYCKEKTGNHSLRLTLQIDEQLRKEPEVKILSRTDIFEQMSARNPAVKLLRDSLNLQIEG